MRLTAKVGRLIWPGLGYLFYPWIRAYLSVAYTALLETYLEACRRENLPCVDIKAKDICTAVSGIKLLDDDTREEIEGRMKKTVGGYLLLRRIIIPFTVSGRAAKQLDKLLENISEYNKKFRLKEIPKDEAVLLVSKSLELFDGFVGKKGL